MAKKLHIRLRSAQRRKLLAIVKTGKRAARRILYAHIALKCADGCTFVELKAGQRHLHIVRRCAKEGGAKAMRYLVDKLYPDAPLDVALSQVRIE